MHSCYSFPTRLTADGLRQYLPSEIVIPHTPTAKYILSRAVFEAEQGKLSLSGLVSGKTAVAFTETPASYGRKLPSAQEIAAIMVGLGRMHILSLFLIESSEWRSCVNEMILMTSHALC